MKLLIRLTALLGWLCLLAQFSSCATSADVATVLSQPVDSTVQHQVAAARAASLFHWGRVKLKGPITIQAGGTGNVATTTDATRAKAPVAAAPDAQASSSQASHGPPWYVYLVVVALAGGLGFALARR